MKVLKVNKLDIKHPQCDLTTDTENFYINIGGKSILVHNSPSIIAGYNNNKFFTATKGAFSKIPKLAYTLEDIKTLYPPYLTEVLTTCLTYLPKVYPSGRIFQGDMLYTKSTLKSVTIDGKQHLSWHPNTINYIVEKNSDIGRQVAASKMGIAVHTEYTIKDDVLSVKGFGVSESLFKKNSNIFLMDANHNTITTMTKFSGSEANAFWSLWKKASSIKTKWDFDKIFETLLVAFVNTYIRAGKTYPNPSMMVTEFKAYCQDKYSKEADKLKTQASKDKKQNQLNSVSSYIDSRIKEFTNIFELFQLIQQMKGIIINKLDSIKSIGTFVVKQDGSMVVTGSEGFVLAAGDGAGVKLVNRLQFSTNNYNSEIVKGFER